MVDVDLCPTGCGRALPVNKVMCAPCWGEVPKDLQREVYAAWRALRNDLTGDNLRRHKAAKDAAIGSIR
jgi:hypothetical protein